MKKVLKDLIFKVLHWFSPHLSGISILMYHSVGDDAAFFTVSPQEFRTQLALIKKSGYPVRRLHDIAADLEAGRPLQPAIVITFDDGYENNCTEALPILKEFGFPATIFVATASIGSSRANSEGIILPMMDEDQLRQTKASGLIDLMPHGHRHIDFSKIPLQEIREDITASVRVIQTLTGVSEPVLAYPWGRYTPQTPIVAQAAGCFAAVTVKAGITRSGDKLFELRRNAVDSGTTVAQFKAKIADAIDTYARFKKS